MQMGVERCRRRKREQRARTGLWGNICRRRRNASQSPAAASSAADRGSCEEIPAGMGATEAPLGIHGAIVFAVRRPGPNGTRVLCDLSHDARIQAHDTLFVIAAGIE